MNSPSKRRSSSFASDAALLALLHRVSNALTVLCKCFLEQDPLCYLVYDFLLQRLSSLQETEEELLDYEPHLYKDEGESDQTSELDDIVIVDQDSLQKVVKDLGPKFKQLALICRESKGEKWILLSSSFAMHHAFLINYRLNIL